jgi:hypothetical protein
MIPSLRVMFDTNSVGVVPMITIKHLFMMGNVLHLCIKKTPKNNDKTKTMLKAIYATL